MRLRLKGSPRRLLASAAARLRRRKRAAQVPGVKGTMGSVIVVRPSHSCFKEVVFVLKEDCLMDPELNRQELLLQAKDYVREALPKRQGPSPLRVALWAALLTAALLLLGLHLAGLL